MSLAIDEYLATGVVPGPRHGLLTGRFACYDCYEASDGGWLSVAAIEPHFWANLCRLLDCEQWIEHQMDDAVQDAIRADLRAAFKGRTRDEWTALLMPADTCVAPVLSVPELVDDPQLGARGAFVDADHPVEGRLRQTGPVLAGQQAPAGPYELPDWSTSDADDVLAGAGFTTDEIERLRAEGAIA
jgi:alpha-methylacyl-CoA racemase